MIDFLGNRKRSEQGVTDFLSARRGVIPQNIARTRGRVEAGREGFLGSSLSSVLGGLPTSSPADTSTVRRKLSSNLGSKLNQQTFGQRTALANTVYDNALRIADEYNMDRQSAEAFARDQVAKASARDFAAKSSAIDRESGQRIQGIQDSAAQRGLELGDQYQPDTNPNSALLRILLGAGTAIGTSYALNKYGGKTPSKIPASNPNAYTGVGPENNLGYYPEYPSFMIRPNR